MVIDAREITERLSKKKKKKFTKFIKKQNTIPGSNGWLSSFQAQI